VSDVGLAVIVKAPVLKTAVCTFSGAGCRVPFAMMTQVVVPETLLFEQPVWYPMGVPLVAAVTLYIAVNRRPVVGVLLMQPGQARTENSIVSVVSTDKQGPLPLTRTPPMHSATIFWGPGRTVPVRSAPAGLRIE
jgi:hypothetical protein